MKYINISFTIKYYLEKRARSIINCSKTKDYMCSFFSILKSRLNIYSISLSFEVVSVVVFV